MGWLVLIIFPLSYWKASEVRVCNLSRVFLPVVSHALVPHGSVLMFRSESPGGLGVEGGNCQSAYSAKRFNFGRQPEPSFNGAVESMAHLPWKSVRIGKLRRASRCGFKSLGIVEPIQFVDPGWALSKSWSCSC